MALYTVARLRPERFWSGLIMLSYPFGLSFAIITPLLYMDCPAVFWAYIVVLIRDHLLFLVFQTLVVLPLHNAHMR